MRQDYCHYHSTPHVMLYLLNLVNKQCVLKYTDMCSLQRMCCFSFRNSLEYNAFIILRLFICHPLTCELLYLLN